jgi:N-carbamoylputrescine amidase
MQQITIAATQMACTDVMETNIRKAEENIRTDSARHWQRTMQGHAAANLMPVCASNRVGIEKGRASYIDFYGASFIAGPDGAIVAQADRKAETVLTATFDLDPLAVSRARFPLFRDRRPEHYQALLTLDGR